MRKNHKILLFQVFILFYGLSLFAQMDTIRYGANLSGRLTTGEVDDYLFEGSSGDKVVIRLAGPDPSMVLLLELLGPDGEKIFRGQQRHSSALRVDTTLNQTGFFTLRIISPEGNNRISYGLSLQKVNPAFSAPVLPHTGQRMENIGQLAEIHPYTFCGFAGDQVQISLKGNLDSFESRMELYSPGGALMAGKQGQDLRFDTTLNEDGLYTLLIASAAGTETGSYTLSLISNGSCVVTSVEQDLCEDQSFIFNGILFDENRPRGITQKDDTLFKIQLSFYQQMVLNLNQTLCKGEFIMVNGTRYDEAHPSGTEFLENQSSFGCDTLIKVDLRFSNIMVHQLNETLCEGEAITVNGTVYDEGNPSGTELFPGGSAGGCDSLVQIQLDFQPPATHEIDKVLCSGEFVIVNGTVYDQSNPAGTEIIEGGASNGCDSLVHIQLDFTPGAESKIEKTLCPDEFITINGTIYEKMNPVGTEVIPGAAANGCDSLIQVQLDFYPEALETLEATLCREESITVNGTVYDQLNPAGTEILFGAAANGCDSLVEVRLDFLEEVAGEVKPTLCPKESITINGTIYNALNPAGEEVLEGGSVKGCDSVILIQLDFYPGAAAEIRQMLCPGESIVVNATEYDESNPAGTEIIAGGSVNGCDSVIYVNLTFGGNCPNIKDFYIPSGITPNGDGINDRFQIPALNSNPLLLDNSELIIQNRWGQKVYQAHPYQNDWEGTNQNGAPLPAGTYFYSLRFGPKGEKLRQGEVTVIR
jgi:gliding motility-associated-like protein